MNVQDRDMTRVTLANASELVTHIVLGVVGNDVADSIEGQPLTRDAISSLAQARFKGALQPHLGGK